jgi:hypothetical protein
LCRPNVLDLPCRVLFHDDPLCGVLCTHHTSTIFAIVVAARRRTSLLTFRRTNEPVGRPSTMPPVEPPFKQYFTSFLEFRSAVPLGGHVFPNFLILGRVPTQLALRKRRVRPATVPVPSFPRRSHLGVIHEPRGHLLAGLATGVETARCCGGALRTRPAPPTWCCKGRRRRCPSPTRTSSYSRWGR